MANPHIKPLTIAYLIMKLENIEKAKELIRAEEFVKKALRTIDSHIEKQTPMDIRLKGLYTHLGNGGRDELKEFDLKDNKLNTSIQDLVKSHLERELELIRQDIRDL